MIKTFVEIGACDFGNNDSLLKEGWVGHFVEPVPVFAQSLQNKLRQTHGLLAHNAKVHQCAISSYDGLAKMQHVNPNTNNWQQWVRGIGNVIGYAKNPIDTRGDFERDHIVNIDVVCYTLDTFFKNIGVDSVDLLQIDTEGHELDILENYSWCIKPKRMVVEHMWCGRGPLQVILERAGYTCTADGEDIFAELN